MSQEGVVVSVYWPGRKDPVDELFDFDFFKPDYTEEGGHCRRDCLKMLEGRLGHYRNVKELPFPTPRMITRMTLRNHSFSRAALLR